MVHCVTVLARFWRRAGLFRLERNASAFGFGTVFWEGFWRGFGGELRVQVGELSMTSDSELRGFTLSSPPTTLSPPLQGTVYSSTHCTGQQQTKSYPPNNKTA
jgi:hypothetical protein